MSEDPEYPSEPSAIHTVLRLPELVQLIVDEFKADPHTLGRVARVDSRFHYPAIKHLWSGSRPVLAKLLDILPDELAKGGFLRSVFRKKVPTEPDWIRLQHYSVHITTLALVSEFYSGDWRPPSAIALLGERNSLHNGALFPRLKTLRVPTTTIRDYPNFEWVLLVGPALRTLSINDDPAFKAGGRDTGPNLEAAFTSFCRHLARKSPHLQHLTMTHFPDVSTELPSALVAALCQALQSLTSLQTLSFDTRSDLASQLTSCVAAHPSISTLRLGPITCALPEAENEGRLFTSVVKLDLYGYPAPLGEVLRAILYPHLVTDIKLQLGDQGPMSYKTFQPFHKLLHAFTHLTSFRLIFEEPAFTWAEFRPLLGIQSITHFSVTPYITGLDDGALADIASAWRGLHTLLLPQNERTEDLRYQVTLLALTPLAKLCPNLEVLTIRFTTRIGPNQTPADLDGNNENTATSSDSSSRLSSLDVGCSEINGRDTDGFLGPRGTSLVLASLWPSIRTLSHRWESDEVPEEDLDELDREMAWRWEKTDSLLSKREAEGNGSVS